MLREKKKKCSKLVTKDSSNVMSIHIGEDIFLKHWISHSLSSKLLIIYVLEHFDC